jgi:hypothetical protein
MLAVMLVVVLVVVLLSYYFIIFIDFDAALPILLPLLLSPNAPQQLPLWEWLTTWLAFYHVNAKGKGINSKSQAFRML